MKDFGDKVKAAEREVKAKASVSEKTKAPYGYKKNGDARKRPASPGRWKKGEAGNPATVWQPGISANPGGRPAKTPITDAMRLYLAQPYSGTAAKFKGMTNASVLAIKQFELAVDKGDMRAAMEIADRVEGKVPQAVKHSGDDDGAPMQFVSMSREENEKRLAALQSKTPVI